MSNNYSTPAWTNGTTPPINAANLKALGEAVETASPLYGVCSTAAATTAKTVTVSFTGTLALFTGLTVTVKFSNSNTAANPTLNVNSTGAKAIKGYGTTAVGVWPAGQVLSFTYDGTNWLTTGVSAYTQNQTLSSTTKAVFNSTFGSTPTYPDDALATLANAWGVSGAKIETGTYEGNGLYGQANALSLTFTINPLLVAVGQIYRTSDQYGGYSYGINPGTGWTRSFIWILGQTRLYSSGSTPDSVIGLSNKTLTWYNDESQYVMCNESGYTYRWIALGN